MEGQASLAIGGDQAVKNTQEEDLKREKRSIEGKMKRRYETMLLMQAEVREFNRRLTEVYRALEEYTPIKRPK